MQLQKRQDKINGFWVIKANKSGIKSKWGFSPPCSVFQVIPWNGKHLTNRKVQRKKVFWHVILHSKCAMLCVSFLSKSKAINVFPKHILKSKARDLSIQARKSCHVIVKNYLCNVSWKFWSKSKTCGGAKSKNRHPRWLYCTVVRQSEAATGGVVHENYS